MAALNRSRDVRIAPGDRRALYAIVVGQVVRRMRTSHGEMSQNRLARIAGLAKSTLSRIENGGLIPRLRTSRAIATALGLSWAEFLQIVEAAHARGFSLAQDGLSLPEAAILAVSEAVARPASQEPARSLAQFQAAVDLLRDLDPALTLYVASDTLCLMDGSSHDDRGVPRRAHILATASGLRISGGDW